LNDLRLSASPLFRCSQSLTFLLSRFHPSLLFCLLTTNVLSYILSHSSRRHDTFSFVFKMFFFVCFIIRHFEAKGSSHEVYISPRHTDNFIASITRRNFSLNRWKTLASFLSVSGIRTFYEYTFLYMYVSSYLGFFSSEGVGCFGMRELFFFLFGV